MSKSFSLDELITNEARAIATVLLESRLREHNLPLPKDSALALHLDQMILVNPGITVTARERVMARKDAHSESLRAIGLEVPELPLPITINLD